MVVFKSTFTFYFGKSLEEVLSISAQKNEKGMDAYIDSGEVPRRFNN